MHASDVTQRRHAQPVQNAAETSVASTGEVRGSHQVGLRTVSEADVPRSRRGWLKAGTSVAVGAAMIGALFGATPKVEAHELYEQTGRVMMDCRFYPCRPVPEMVRVPHPHGHGRVIVVEPQRHPDVVIIEQERRPDVVVIERERRDPRDFERGVVTGVLGVFLGCVLIGPCGH